MSTLEKAFRMVDIGPNAESKDEVYSSVHIQSLVHFVFKFVSLQAIQPLLMI